MGELTALIIVGSCGIIMIAAIIIVSIYSSKETYKDEVFAEIIEYEEYATDTYGKMYVAVLKYTYNDKEYIVKDKNRKFRDSDERYKYDILTLGINPKEPTDFIVKTSLTEFVIPSRDKKVIIIGLIGIVVVAILYNNSFALLGLMGVVLLCVAIRYYMKNPRAKWVEVEAEIIETEKVSTKGGPMLVHVYRYTYEDKEYKVRANWGTYYGKGRVGSTRTIKIDSSNPEKIKEEFSYNDMSPYQKTNINIFTWFGIALLIFIVFNLIRYMFV